MKTIIFLVLVLGSRMVLAGEVVLPPDLLFVGDGSGQCTYTTIQAAIDDAPPNSEIRVTTDHGTFVENLIVDKNLTIKGGYSSCGLAQLDSRADENRTIVQGNAGQSIMTVLGDNRQFSLSGFRFENGQYGGLTPAGGLTLAGESSEYLIERVDFINNTGFYGGGLYVSGDSQVSLVHSEVRLNQADLGGGIYCTSGATVHLRIGSEVKHNQAIDGGGLYANDCRVELKIGSPGALDGIALNNADDFGGGVYLHHSELSIQSDPEYDQFAPTRLALNTANVDGDASGGGGAVAAYHSTVNIGFGRFTRNRVRDGHGGAILLNNSDLKVDTLVYCLFYNDVCADFVENTASQLHHPGTYVGGAIHAHEFSNVATAGTPLRTYFIENKADLGSAMHLYDNTTAHIQSSYFIENGELGFGDTDDQSVVTVDGANTEARIRFSTFGNNATMAALNVKGGGTIDLRGAIVHDIHNNNVINNEDGSGFFHGCNIYNEGDSMGAVSFPSLVTDDPGFVDPANQSYHLKPDSVAIDRCNLAGIIEAIRSDLDGDTRAIDWLNVDQGVGDYDAGGDEYNDVIFESGFDPAGSGVG